MAARYLSPAAYVHCAWVAHGPDFTTMCFAGERLGEEIRELLPLLEVLLD